MVVFFAGGTWARACLKVLVGCVVFAAVLFRAGIAEASHFRYGTISWTVPDPVNAPRTVVFVVVAAWRSASIGSTQLTFGDAAGDTTKTGATIGTGVDSIGAAYTVTQYSVAHTYATNGPFTAQYTSSARVAGLINGANGTFTVQTHVALGGSPVNTAGPSSASPAIIQLQQGGTRTYTFPMSDVDLDPVTCRTGTAAETGLPVGQEIAKVPANGAVPVLASLGTGCRITWDLSQAVVGQQYVIHVVMESTHAGVISSTAIDLLAEIVTPPPPACAGTGIFNVIAGQTVTAPTTATWGTVGNAVVTVINKPATATLSPGGSGASPFSNTLTWTPAIADRGTSTVITVNYTNQQNLGGACFITVNVAACLCSGNTPVCDFSTSVCTACVGDKGSPAANACPSAVNPYCAAAGACTKCTVNADCAGATHAGAFCNAAAGACVTCLADADCTSGQFCNTQTFACT